MADLIIFVFKVLQEADRVDLIIFVFSTLEGADITDLIFFVFFNATRSRYN